MSPARSLSSKNPPGPTGQRLKALRIALGISGRDVQAYSRVIARAQRDSKYHISHSSLIDIENSTRTPGIHKLFTLSALYRINFVDLLLFFGIDLEQLSKEELAVKLPKTHLVPSKVYDAERPAAFPVRFDPGVRIGETNLISRMVQTWGEVPISFLQHLGIRNHLYGFIGMDDYTLYPMIRPGAFVQIDDQDTNIEVGKWETEFERPIYFLQLREGYACGWCWLEGKVLTIVPHPLSRVESRRFNLQDDVDVVGRVVGVAISLPRKPLRASLPIPADRAIQ
jgi:transcriptional regulator with XRE-family HTH domain